VTYLRVRQRCIRVFIAAMALFALASTPASAAARRVPFGTFGVDLDTEIPAYVSPAALDAQMALMARSGVESVRTDFLWPEIEPARNRYDWAPADELVRLAAKHGLQLLPIIEFTPVWASSNPSDPAATLYAPAHLSTFAGFVTQLVRRYGPRGSFWRLAANRGIRDPIVDWQIWNEPAGNWDWRSTPWDTTYAALLAAGYKAIHRADRHAVVVSASLVGATGHQTPWAEASALYRDGLRRYSDVIAVNAFSGAPSASASVSDSILDVGYVRDVMDANGDAHKPIWITEVTWTAALGRIEPKLYIDIETTPQGQAQRLALYYQTIARSHPYGIQRAYWYTWASEYRRSFDFGIAATFQFAGLEQWRPGQPFTSLPLLRTYAATAARFEHCHKSSDARVCRG
jgi:hypothetical protein